MLRPDLCHEMRQIHGDGFDLQIAPACVSETRDLGPMESWTDINSPFSCVQRSHNSQGCQWNLRHMRQAQDQNVCFSCSLGQMVALNAVKTTKRAFWRQTIWG
jgi:hypothetical protein